jgi:aryl-alcohol dehydrogenase-like predicted oxidoreductase
VPAQGAIPIPGTKNVSRPEENFDATNVTLSQNELKEIRSILDTVPTVEGRLVALPGLSVGVADMA